MELGRDSDTGGQVPRGYFIIHNKIFHIRLNKAYKLFSKCQPGISFFFGCLCT